MAPLHGHVNKFTRKDFMFWKFKIKTMLKSRNLWGHIDGSNVKLFEMALLHILFTKKKAVEFQNIIILKLFDIQSRSRRRRLSITKRIWEVLEKQCVNKGFILIIMHHLIILIPIMKKYILH
jgi:hypothetical protein